MWHKKCTAEIIVFRLQHIEEEPVARLETAFYVYISSFLKECGTTTEIMV